MHDHAPPPLSDHARSVLADERRAMAFDTAGYPAEIRAAFDDYSAAVAEILTVGAELEGQLADLDRDRDLYPAQGYQRLRGERVNDAIAASREAERRAEAAAGELRERLADQVVPRVPESREMLARQELQMLLDVPGVDARTAAIRVANGDTRDGLAALMSPFGRALLQSRGVYGRDLDETMAAVRSIAIGTAAQHPGRHTGAELTAAAARDRVPGLAFAAGLARRHVLRVAGAEE